MNHPKNTALRRNKRQHDRSGTGMKALVGWILWACEDPGQEPTHLVSFWGVRCYLHEPTRTLWGVNRIYNALIPVASFFHNALSAMTMFLIPTWKQPGFPLKVLKTFK